jgi:hypothetical protein
MMPAQGRAAFDEIAVRRERAAEAERRRNIAATRLNQRRTELPTKKRSQKTGAKSSAV